MCVIIAIIILVILRTLQAHIKPVPTRKDLPVANDAPGKHVRLYPRRIAADLQFVKFSDILSFFAERPVHPNLL